MAAWQKAHRLAAEGKVGPGTLGGMGLGKDRVPASGDEQGYENGRRDPNLAMSHGCVHLRPIDRDEMMDKDHLAGGVQIVVHPYGRKPLMEKLVESVADYIRAKYNAQ